jgi:peroxiredoxin, Ohr subfamily
MEAIYTATATSIGGRNGHITSSDHVLDMDLRTPVAMGGKEEGYTNPEQLFAAGYAACFNGALAHKLLLRRLRPVTTVTAHVSIGNNDQGEGFKLSVVMDINIPEVDMETAKELADEAHHFCPYSNATRGNIDVKLNVTNHD